VLGAVSEVTKRTMGLNGGNSSTYSKLRRETLLRIHYRSSVCFINYLTPFDIVLSKVNI